MTERPSSASESASLPRQALLLQKLNALKADIAETVRAIVAAGGSIVQLNLPLPSGEKPWTDQELVLARRALINKYQGLQIDFVVLREDLDVDALFAEVMQEGADQNPVSKPVGTDVDLVALKDTATDHPVAEEKGTKKPVVNTSAAAADILRRMRRRPS